MADSVRERGAPPRTFVSSSVAATEALASLVGAALPRSAVVALDGDLGSGKTVFVRGLARGLGVREPVTSPTYALMHTYPGDVELSHFDAWMEGRERSFLLDGGLDGLQDGNVAVIEWAERVVDLLPLPRLHVAFEHVGEHQRRIRVWAEEGPLVGGELSLLVARLGVPKGIVEVV